VGGRVAPGGRFGLVAIAVAALLLMAGALAAVLLLPGLSGPPATDAPTGGIVQGEGFLCDPGEAAQMLPYLDGVAQIAPDRVARLDLSGNAVWSATISMEAPVGTIAGGRLLVVDPGGFQAAVYDADGLVWSAETAAHIDGATISASGHVAVLTDDPGYKGVVNVFAPDGTLLFQWMSSETGYVLSASVDPTGTRVDVSALYTDGAAARPVYRSFAMTGGQLSLFQLDAGSALPRIVYDEKGRPILCGEEETVCFSQGALAGEIAWRLSAEGIRTVLPSAKGPVWLHDDATGTATSIARLRDGAEGPICVLASTPTVHAVLADHAAVATAGALTVVDLAKGTVVFQRTFTADVLALGFVDEGHLVAVTRNSVQRVELP